MHKRIQDETSVEISGGAEAGQGGGKGGIKVSDKHEKEMRTRKLYRCLTQGGFTFLSRGIVMPFAVETSDRLMYISVHDESKSWCWDMQVNPQLYGCVTIKEDEKGHISIFPSNPEPRWRRTTKEYPIFPSDAVELYHRSDNVVVYLAKVNYDPRKDESSATGFVNFKFPVFGHVPVAINGFLDGVWDGNGTLCKEYPLGGLDELFTEDLLLASKYEWVKAQRGNIIPPNAVKTTLLLNGSPTETYVGRVGGEIVCIVSITDGMVGYFTDKKGSQATSGEILLLTVDTSV